LLGAQVNPNKPDFLSGFCFVGVAAYGGKKGGDFAALPQVKKNTSII